STQYLKASFSSAGVLGLNLLFSRRTRLTNLNSNERSFFPDEVDIEDESLTVRLEANLDGEDLTVSRFFPYGQRILQ
uniref:hypothetical protein n=1 Tax=uncultured Varibaculum sp. TaxID=413896 RepID=UPI0027D9BF4D